MRAVDSNVLVRALTRDAPEQAARAQALLTEAEVYVPVTVMLELESVLRSRYGYGPKLDFTAFDADLARRAGRGAKVVPPVRRI